MPINPAGQDAAVHEALHMGFRVEKSAGASIASGETTLFTISGKVLVTQIIGEVTTVIQNQTTAIKLVYDPTNTGADVDLCATVDTDADAVGTYYSITGDVSDAMIALLNLVEADAMMEKRGIMLDAGEIHQNSGAASSGVIVWYLWYVPLEDGAVVEAA